MRGVTTGLSHMGVFRMISTRTPHAGSDMGIHIDETHIYRISTRTPHAGSDMGIHIDGTHIYRISTRTPHAGSDRNIMRKFTASINI